MPYSGPDDSSLPENIKKMPHAARARFAVAFNAVMTDCSGDSAECEKKAFPIATAAANKAIGEAEKCDDYMDSNPGSGSGMGSPAHRQADQQTAQYDPFGATGGKGCANCLFFNSPDKCSIVMDYPLPITATGLSKFYTPLPDWVLTPPDVGDMDNSGDAAADKAAVVKRENGNDFSASAYAVVPDPQSPSTWKLRLEETPDRLTVAQIARAITAMQPGGFRGNRVELSADEKRQAVSKISGAIGRVSGDDNRKQALRERLNAVKGGRGMAQTLLSAFARVKAAAVGQRETAQEVESQRGSNFKIFQKADGSYSWLAIATNRYRDREGETFSAEAHKRFIRKLETKEYPMPELWLWHTPGSRIGQATDVAFDGDFVLYSGQFDDGAEHAAKALAQEPDLGVSHGYHFDPKDLVNGVYNNYQTFEVSPLPMDAAANPYTAFTSYEEIKGMTNAPFTPRKREWLDKMLGPGSAVKFEENPDGLKAACMKAGVNFKDIPEDEPEQSGNRSRDLPPAPVGTDALKAAMKELGLDTLAPGLKAVGDGLKSLAERADVTDSALKSLGERLDKLEKSDDEKIADLFRPRTVRGGYRASDAKDNTPTSVESEPARPMLDKHFLEFLTGEIERQGV